MITRRLSIRSETCDLTTSKVNEGSAEGAGSISFLTSGDLEIVKIFFANPAYDFAVDGVASARDLPISNTSIGTDQIGAKFIVYNRDNEEQWRGTLGLSGSGADLIVASVNFTANTLVRIEPPFTYTEP
jgi:hypothetical protein